jgi:putative oxidoreductase
MIPSRRARANRNINDTHAEVARLLLRTALGATFIAHGIRHGATIDGTARWFESIGFKQPRLQAQLSSVIEVGSGAAVVAGLATPLSASAMVGTMSVAFATVHRRNGYFVISEGWEYVGFISAAAIALSSLGPGRFSADRLLGIDSIGKPLSRAGLTAALGLAGAALQLRTFWEPATS